MLCYVGLFYSDMIPIQIHYNQPVTISSIYSGHGVSSCGLCSSGVMKETPWPGNIDWFDDWLDLYHQQSIRGIGLMGSPLVKLDCEFCMY